MEKLGSFQQFVVPQFDTFVMNASISYIQLKDEFLFYGGIDVLFSSVKHMVADG